MKIVYYEGKQKGKVSRGNLAEHADEKKDDRVETQRGDGGFYKSWSWNEYCTHIL
jgi:hypothetical protein